LPWARAWFLFGLILFWGELVIGRQIKISGMVLAFIDMLVILGCFALAFYAKKYVILSEPKLDEELYSDLIALEAPFILLVLAVNGLYSPHTLLSTISSQIRLIIRGTIAAILVFFLVSFYAKIFSYAPSRVVLSLFFVLMPIGLILTRYVFFWAQKSFKALGINVNVIFFECAESRGRLRKEFESSTYCRFNTVAVFKKEEESYAEGIRMIEQGEVDSVVIDLPMEQHDAIASITNKAEEEGVSVYFSPRALPSTMLNLSRVMVGTIPMIALQPPELPLYGMVLKRAMDIVLSMIILAIIWPLMLALAVLVKLTSKGPILYRQERIGIDGKKFTMLKFRTMREDACANGPIWGTKNDIRCTPVGGMLRRLNLDELPQLFNVLAGSMSLVGPRPEETEFVLRFKKEVGRYTHKHWVKPGITGWAQVNGWRGDTDMDERIRHDIYYIEHWSHDIYYIEHWSLWLDLKILLMTPIYGFRNAM